MPFKEYAPYIEEVIPAFDSSKIIVPFERNPVVPDDAVAGLRIQIRNLNSTILVAAVETTGMPEKGQPAIFETPTGNLRVGQWYNVQMAYILKSEVVGAYSAEAVTKYIGMPSITTIGDNINSIQIVYVDQSLTEPIDTYELIAKTEADVVIAATGPRTHDASLDKVEYNTGGDAIARTANLEPWSLYSVPQDSTKLYVNYKITTHNLYEATGQFIYDIPQSSNEVSNIESLTVSMSDEDKCTGVVNIIVNAKPLEADEEYTAASYKLLRSEDKGFIWDEIARFSTSGGTEFNFSIQDRTVAHGTTYKYAVVQYNSNGVYSQRIESDYITAEFEHMFLCDATRSLCIKFNPKVSSLKETILESKSDTIGGKYPFFFRNGETRYKEIPIQGLISYWMDDKEQFIKRSALGLTDGGMARPETKTQEDLGNIPTTNLVDYNVTAERIMKLEVLEWLNNGQPKLFRSPTEGNYLIRLMNVSLSPEDKLSRLIHSFSATGYEIGEPNIRGMIEANIINPSSQEVS